jgi:hypothetical protein
MRRLLIVALAAAALVAAVAFSSSGSNASPPAHVHRIVPMAAVPSGLAPLLVRGRLATAKYATDLALAKRDGYGIITRMIPDMGYHFLNGKIKGFDVAKPSILVYVKRGGRWQLVAFEWVFTEKPKTPPLPGAQYGSFGAACHYKDGTFVFTESQDACAQASPESGAPFNFWHPDLVTLHLWLWYPNPDGIFAGKNPLMRPFNRG